MFDRVEHNNMHIDKNSHNSYTLPVKKSDRVTRIGPSVALASSSPNHGPISDLEGETHFLSASQKVLVDLYLKEEYEESKARLAMIRELQANAEMLRAIMATLATRNSNQGLEGEQPPHVTIAEAHAAATPIAIDSEHNEEPFPCSNSIPTLYLAESVTRTDSVSIPKPHQSVHLYKPPVAYGIAPIRGSSTDQSPSRTNGTIPTGPHGRALSIKGCPPRGPSTNPTTPSSHLHHRGLGHCVSHASPRLPAARPAEALRSVNCNRRSRAILKRGSSTNKRCSRARLNRHFTYQALYILILNWHILYNALYVLISTCDVIHRVLHAHGKRRQVSKIRSSSITCNVFKSNRQWERFMRAAPRHPGPLGLYPGLNEVLPLPIEPFGDG